MSGETPRHDEDDLAELSRGHWQFHLDADGLFIASPPCPPYDRFCGASGSTEPDEAFKRWLKAINDLGYGPQQPDPSNPEAHGGQHGDID